MWPGFPGLLRGCGLEGQVGCLNNSLRKPGDNVNWLPDPKHLFSLPPSRVSGWLTLGSHGSLVLAWMEPLPGVPGRSTTQARPLVMERRQVKPNFSSGKTLLSGVHICTHAIPPTCLRLSSTEPDLAFWVFQFKASSHATCFVLDSPAHSLSLPQTPLSGLFSIGIICCPLAICHYSEAP